MLRNFWLNEDGVGTIEICLITLVLVGLILVFKKQARMLLDNIFREIGKKTREVY